MNRKTVVAGSIVLAIIAVMLVITSYVTGEAGVLVAAIVVGAVAMVLLTQARKPPNSKDNP